MDSIERARQWFRAATQNRAGRLETMRNCDSHAARRALATGLRTQALAPAVNALASVLNDADSLTTPETWAEVDAFIRELAEESSDYYSVSAKDVSDSHPTGDAPNYPDFKAEIKAELLQTLRNIVSGKFAHVRFDPSGQIFLADPAAPPLRPPVIAAEAASLPNPTELGLRVSGTEEDKRVREILKENWKAEQADPELRRRRMRLDADMAAIYARYRKNWPHGERQEQLIRDARKYVETRLSEAGSPDSRSQITRKIWDEFVPRHPYSKDFKLGFEELHLAIWTEGYPTLEERANAGGDGGGAGYEPHEADLPPGAGINTRDKLKAPDSIELAAADTNASEILLPSNAPPDMAIETELQPQNMTNDELGDKVHDLLEEYVQKMAESGSNHRQLLARLARKLYDVHTAKRIDLVRHGHPEDVAHFDDEHEFRAELAVWQPLRFYGVRLDGDEPDAIELALTGARIRWRAAAERRVRRAVDDAENAILLASEPEGPAGTPEVIGLRDPVPVIEQVACSKAEGVAGEIAQRSRAATVAMVIKELDQIKPQMFEDESEYEKLRSQYPNFLVFKIAESRPDLKLKLLSIRGSVRHIRLAQEFAAAQHGREFSTIQEDWKNFKPAEFRRAR